MAQISLLQEKLQEKEAKSLEVAAKVPEDQVAMLLKKIEALENEKNSKDEKAKGPEPDDGESEKEGDDDVDDDGDHMVTPNGKTVPYLQMFDI